MRTDKRRGFSGSGGQASLLLADRCRNTAAIATEAVLRYNPNANLLEIEQAFRDSAAAAYLVATTERFEVGLGLMAMLAAVAKASAIHFTPTTSASWINQVERH